MQLLEQFSRSKSEMRKHYREGQEDYIGALGLLTNTLCYGIQFTCKQL